MLSHRPGGTKLYPIDYFIAMATLSTCFLLIWAVLGIGSSAAVLGRHEDFWREHEGLLGVAKGGRIGGGNVTDVKSEGGGKGNDLKDVLGEAKKGKYDYPTSFTQGIITKAIHSHNDYWRPVPFYTALSLGCISIEADVWLYNSTLYVGHERAALTQARTFESLYIEPILDVLKRQNPKSEFVDEGEGKMGVFDANSGQTLYLWVDVKTDGKETWEAVIKALEPLRSAGYLTKVNGTNFISGAVTVIGTGNTPLDLVQPVNQRDYFWDAPISTLGTIFSEITPLVSPIASTDFKANFGPVVGTSLNETQLSLLRKQVETVHSKGIKLRYWDQPNWPVGTRNGIWRQLRTEGVDFINVDDVNSAANDNW